ETATPETSTAETATPEFSAPVTRKRLVRDKETDHLVYTDPETKTELRLTRKGKSEGDQQAGWYRVDPAGKETFVGASQKIALENINKPATGDLKLSYGYQARAAEGSLVIPKESIPTGSPVTGEAVKSLNREDGGIEIAEGAEMKDVVEESEKTQSILAQVLKCVSS
ncbi:MAG: hypothetical protein KAG92_10970, partial [Deltaproteobacteria bacterium]|nr:hypothetical protein [Deltaproteobacteria bacterium]